MLTNTYKFKIQALKLATTLFNFIICKYFQIYQLEFLNTQHQANFIDNRKKIKNF